MTQQPNLARRGRAFLSPPDFADFCYNIVPDAQIAVQRRLHLVDLRAASSTGCGLLRASRRARKTFYCKARLFRALRWCLGKRRDQTTGELFGNYDEKEGSICPVTRLPSMHHLEGPARHAEDFCSQGGD